MSRQKIYWGWFNRRTRITHCFTPWSSYTHCGILTAASHVSLYDGSKRCKRCLKALES